MLRDLQLACRAIVAQFIRPSVFVTGIVLSIVVVFIAKLVPPVDFHFLGLSSGIAAVLFCRTLFQGWLRDPRLREMLVFPFSERSLALASVFIGAGVYLIEGLIPLGVFFSQAGYGSAQNYFFLLLFSLFLSLTVLAISTINFRYSVPTAYLLGFALAMVAGYVSLTAALSLSFVVLLVAASLGLHLPVSRRPSHARPITFFRDNYFATNAFNDSRVWSSFVLISIFTGYLSWSLAKEGISPLIFLTLAVVNTAQTTVLSRNPETRAHIYMLGDVPRSAVRLAGVNLVLFLFGALVPVGIGFFFKTIGWGQLVLGLFSCFVGAVGSSWLEFKFPLHGIKSDRDALRHPRKYLMPLVIVCMILPFFLLKEV